MWVGILENENVGCKSICMPGKINNGLLNDMKNELFQVYVYSPVFPMTFSRYSLLLFLFHSLEVHFMNCYNNHHIFVGPLSIKTKHISLVLSKHRKYIELSPSCLYLFLSVLSIEQCYTGLLTTPQGIIM